MLGNTATDVLRSPKGSYSVSLIGNRSKPLLPLSYSNLTATVSGRDSLLCSNVDLFRADFFDRAFAVKYPTTSWPHENVLRFQTKFDKRSDLSDIVWIKNESAQIVQCLKVQLVDLFLIMDMQAGDTLQVPVTRQPGGAVYFAAEARLQGQPLLTTEDGGTRDDYHEPSITYGITLRGDKVSFQMPAAREGRGR
jgi:hypothetical protein